MSDHGWLRRGHMVLVSLDPAVGREASKTRPGIIVSNNTANSVASRRSGSVVTVVPVTSNISRVFDFHVLLPAEATGLDRDCKAQAEQVRSVSTDRIVRPLAWIPAELMAAVDDALRLHLALA